MRRYPGLTPWANSCSALRAGKAVRGTSLPKSEDRAKEAKAQGPSMMLTAKHGRGGCVRKKE